MFFIVIAGLDPAIQYRQEGMLFDSKSQEAKRVSGSRVPGTGTLDRKRSDFVCATLVSLNFGKLVFRQRLAVLTRIISVDRTRIDRFDELFAHSLGRNRSFVFNNCLLVI